MKNLLPVKEEMVPRFGSHFLFYVLPKRSVEHPAVMGSELLRKSHPHVEQNSAQFVSQSPALHHPNLFKIVKSISLLIFLPVKEHGKTNPYIFSIYLLIPWSCFGAGREKAT